MNVTGRERERTGREAKQRPEIETEGDSWEGNVVPGSHAANDASGGLMLQLQSSPRLGDQET